MEDEATTTEVTTVVDEGSPEEGAEAAAPAEGQRRSTAVGRPSVTLKSERIYDALGRPKGRMVRRKKKKPPPPDDKPDYASVPGVQILPITDYTQRAMGIIVGEDVTMESPWKRIKREAALENLEVYQASSDFRPIAEELAEMDADDFLMGYTLDESKTPSEFFVTTSAEATEGVQNLIDRMMAARAARIANAVNKVILPYHSSGSEREVDDSIARGTRPLLEIEIESVFPMEQKTLQFEERRPEQARDGYMELRPTRFIIGNVQRRRVDVAVQCGSTKTESSAQTQPPYPKNACIQYEYDCTEAIRIAQETQAERLALFLAQIEPIMTNNIRFNGVIDIYFNDYPELREKATRIQKVVTGDSMVMWEYQCFTDIRICKDKLVSCSAWHPMWSGIVAVAYVSEPACSTNRSRREVDVVNRAVHELNPVLVWSFDEGLKPKLWLENYREVTALSFCPYDENIIIGGCSSGQILLWDLTKRLQKVEQAEILTVAQSKYRVLMFSHMEWMKNVRNDASVRPAAGSALQHSHRSPVHTIHWLSPHWSCSRTGQIHMLPPEDSKRSRQFITASEDGTLLVWDLTLKGLARQVQILQRVSRIIQRPPGLTTDVSPYKLLDRVLKPKYRLLVKRPGSERLRIALTKCAFIKNPVNYEQCSVTPAIYNISNRILYKPVTECPDAVKQEFIAGSCEGDFLIATWEGFEYNQGQLINTETAKIQSRGVIHDGPVTDMDRHKFLPHLHMTVGGKIFAIWDETYPNRPLMWRKLEVKLTCCLWSQFQSNIFYLTRDDGTVEIWDFLYRSNCAATVQSLSGKILSNIGVHTLPLIKNIIGIGDYNGSFRCFYVPPAFQKIDEVDESRMVKFFEHEKIRKVTLCNWQEQWIKSNVEIREKKREQEELEQKLREQQQQEERKRLEERLRQEEEERKKLAAKEGERPEGAFVERAEKAWKEGLRDHMQKVLLQTKRLKLEDLEQQQRPLKLLAQQQKRKMQKQKARYAQADQIYDEQLAILFPDDKKAGLGIDSGVFELPPEEEEAQEVVPEVSEVIPEPLDTDEGAAGDASATEIRHLGEYATCEEGLREYVAQNQYIYVFNWKSVLADGKDRRLLIDHQLVRRRAHRRRQEQRRKMRDKLPQSQSSAEFDQKQLRKIMGLPPLYPLDEDEEGSSSMGSAEEIKDRPVAPEQMGKKKGKKDKKKGKKGKKEKKEKKKKKKAKGEEAGEGGEVKEVKEGEKKEKKAKKGKGKDKKK